MDIKVSVILPSLNVADYIGECMESIMNQTLNALEIICVDAGSEDGTREILEGYAVRDPRIMIIDSGVRSYGYQVNTGISAARGKYIGIVETDDYIADDMYEKLFEVAEEHRLDYVMSDYKSFYDDDNNERVYHEIKGVPEMYGRIFSIHDHARLYTAGDVNLWRGIYAREFLEAGHIRLNETPGAAYQDIGFMHRVRMKARRSMYLNHYGYFYRTDRNGSSINSMRGLQYAKYEYQYLLENEDIPKEYMGRFYYMMAWSLIGEGTKILSRCGYVWGKEDSDCHEWFQRTLANAIDEGLLRESMMDKTTWRQLNALLASRDDYAGRLKLSYDNIKQFETIAKTASMIVICGAGRRGAAMLKMIRDVDSDAGNRTIVFADNNSSLWNTYLDGIKINPMDMCAATYPDAYFVIANKLHNMDIMQQLLADGVADERIYEYKPSINWD